MAVITYLTFRKNSQEVLDFYEKALDGTEKMVMTMSDLPEDPNYPMPEEDKGLIANASIKVAGGLLMFSDVPDSMADTFVEGSNLSVSIVDKDKELLTKYFNNMSEGAKVLMPLGQTPWSELYGAIIDKFGVRWQFNHSNDDYYYDV